MAGVKRITRDEISTIRDNEDAWQIVMNPKRPRKRPRLAEEASSSPYIYEQKLEEFDRRLNFHYSVTLYGGVVDWKKRGKGAEKFKTYDKIEYSGLSISIGDIVYVNFGDPDEIPGQPNAEDADIKDSSSSSSSVADKVGGTDDAEAEEDHTPESISHWVAKVLECRAFDEEHVFLRVLWLYRPEDLPMGRKPWHGSNEVFPSNNMQIIDAMTVTDMAEGLVKWDEKARQVVDKGVLLWRQPCKVAVKGGDVAATVLGKLPTYCVCREPANPDRHLIQCKACKNWLHDTCIEREVVKRVSARGLPGHDETPCKEKDTDEDKAPATDTAMDGKPTPTHTSFHPISGTVKLITKQLKRAASPFKHSAAARLVGEAAAVAEDLGKTVKTVAPATLSKNFTARVVGLDPKDEEMPMRVEIRSSGGGDGGDDAPLAVEKVKCLVCEHEIE